MFWRWIQITKLRTEAGRAAAVPGSAQRCTVRSPDPTAARAREGERGKQHLRELVWAEPGQPRVASIPPPSPSSFPPSGPRAAAAGSCQELRAPSASPLPRRAPPPAAGSPPGPDIIAGRGDGRSRTPPPAPDWRAAGPLGRRAGPWWAGPEPLSALRNWADWNPRGAGLPGCGGPCGCAVEGGGARCNLWVACRGLRLCRCPGLEARPALGHGSGEGHAGVWVSPAAASVQLWSRALGSAAAPGRLQPGTPWELCTSERLRPSCGRLPGRALKTRGIQERRTRVCISFQLPTVQYRRISDKFTWCVRLATSVKFKTWKSHGRNTATICKSNTP